MKLCVFQGTFNPIHKVHIEVAKFVKQYYGFDNIIFIPAFIPPHKNVNNLLAKHRYNMVKLAISDYEFLKISDIEYKRNEYSYTYNTIVELYKTYEIDGKINFIIGTDAFINIKTWYKYDLLKNLVHFIVFKRTNNFKESDFSFLKDEGFDFEFSPMNYMEVSSTELRHKIHSGISVKDIEIPSVLEYINKHELYK